MSTERNNGEIKTHTVNLKGAMERLGVRYTFAQALKRAAGVNSKLFDWRRLRDYWEAHPDFKIAEIYPPKKKSANRLCAVS